MNKSAVVARVARRMGLNRYTAEGAADTVLEAIAESVEHFPTLRDHSGLTPTSPCPPPPKAERAGWGVSGGSA